MIYQLPNGKVINISIETYLRMTDEDLRYLSESNAGTHVSNTSPFNISEAAAKADMSQDSDYIDPDVFDNNYSEDDIDYPDINFNE